MSVVDSRHNVQGWIAGARAALARETAYARGDMAAFDIVDVLDVPEAAWAELSTRSADSNPFYHPAWARAVARHAEDHKGARALIAWDSPAKRRMIGFLPVVPAWHALHLPIPVFAAWYAYAPLTTPLLDRDHIEAAARALIAAAEKAGAQALLLTALADDTIAAKALRDAVASFGIEPRVFDRHERAQLDATQDGDEAIATLGNKKVKELRRQRNRLSDNGEVVFKVAKPGGEATAALDAFLALEAAGWKGVQGTALASKAGDTAMLKEALPRMVADRNADLVTLASADKVFAAGVLLRHQRNVCFFKIAYDEDFAKMSPGVQITLDITKAACADSGIDTVDSTAVANHPMIDHIWRGRLAMADVLLPTQANKPAFKLFSVLIAARRRARGIARSLYHRLRSLKG